MDKKLHEKAIALVQRLESHYTEFEDESKLKLVYMTSLRLYSQIGDKAGGMQSFARMLALSDDQGRFELAWIAHSMYGQFLHEFEDLSDAVEQFYQSAQALESYRQAVPMDNFDRIAFFGDKVAHLNYFCRVAIENDDLHQAWFFLESGKSKHLLDLLSANASFQDRITTR
ncbi:MAG: hypothetical protein AAFZ63_20630 [Bacteroidota bacterium]